MSLSVESAASELQKLGAETKLSKSGSVLVVDFRPVASQIDDSHLVLIVPLDKLREIYLDGSAVTDAVLNILAEKDKLATIDLQNTSVTDNGIERLKDMQTLKLLLLNGSSVTRDGVNQIRKSMLKTRIVFF